MYLIIRMIPTEQLLTSTQLFWQYPVITEKEFFNQNKNDDDFFGFPWATCIDKRIDTNQLFKLLVQFKTDNPCYTCCQHISFRKLIPLFKVLNITTVYTPHKIKNEDEIKGVKLLPCPLYAVNFEDKNRNKEFENIDFLKNERKYLYSFMGGVQPGYLTNIRKNIFTMKHSEDTLIINTGDWHYNTTVYSNKQNFKNELNIDQNHVNKTKKYNETLINSRYSLCPSGSGPNSIRFWESIACGCIPVLLADTLELPHNIEWENAIVILEEKNISNVYHVLTNIDENKEEEMRENCLKIYKNLSNNFKNNYK